MAFKDGDFVEVDYTLWDEEDKKVLATTMEEVAKKENIYDNEVKYEPALVVLGANAVVKGLENQIKSMNIGEEKVITLTPEEAFGKRDESLIKVMKLSDFRERNINPYVGMRVNIDGMPVVVKSIGSGRVVVDANHPNAGKSVRYELKVLNDLREPKGRMDALARIYNARPTSISVNDNEAELFYDKDVRKDSNYFIDKASSLAAIFSYMKSIKRIIVKEEYVNESDLKKDSETEEKGEKPAENQS